MASELPPNVKRAAMRFKAKRADYYGYLANILRATKGQTKFEQLFLRDSQRYGTEPRGVLSSYWYEKFQQNGADLAAAWDGTLPQDEVSIIRVAQGASSEAVIESLEDVARLAALNDRIKSEIRMIMTVAIVAFLIAALMSTVFAMFSAMKLQEVYSFVPLDSWGKKGKAYVNYADGVKTYAVYFIALLGLLAYLFMWSLPNWIGPRREWLDTHVGIYKIARDIKGALFLSTMATLTRKRASGMDTLTRSLETFLQSVKTPWLTWRIEQIIQRINETGGISSDVFHTNMITKEMFYYLRDTQESLGFSQGFEQTGQFVETRVVKDIITRMTIYRWVMLIVAVLVVVGVFGWQMSVIYEMKGVMQNYFSSR